MVRAHEWATREQAMRNYELFVRYVMPVFQQPTDTPIGSNTQACENRKQVFGAASETVRRASTDFGAAMPAGFKQRTLGGGMWMRAYEASDRVAKEIHRHNILD